jgi:hypothetical protein
MTQPANSQAEYLTPELVSLRPSGTKLSSADLAWLMVAGALAALAVALVHMSLRVPGHAIFKPLLPVAIGLARAPRHGSGWVVGLSAAATSAVLLLSPWGHIQVSTFTSLVLLGPAFEVAARGWHTKGLLFIRFALAGIATNSVAVLVKLTTVSFGLESGGGRGFAALWPVSLFSFLACGAVAGLLAAAICVPRSRRGDAIDQP